MPGMFSTFRIAAPGTNVAVTGSSVATAIPDMGTVDSDQPRYVAVSTQGSEPVYIATGAAAITTAVATGMLINVGQNPIILGVGGETHIAAIADGVGSELSITPLSTH